MTVKAYGAQVGVLTLAAMNIIRRLPGGHHANP